MSYACLLINENGACAAAESRLSISTWFDLLFPRLHLHHDHETKVFCSREQKLVWAFTGVTTRGFLHFPTMVRLILQNDAIPLEERLALVKRKVCRHTRQLRFVTKFMQLTRQIKTPEDAKCSFLYNLMYAYYDEEGRPCLGSLSIKNGCVVYDRHYSGNLFIENGMNMASLTSRNDFVPHKGETLAQLKSKAIIRVQESIDKDAQLGRMDPRYRITIGGKIRTAVILPPPKKPEKELKTS